MPNPAAATDAIPELAGLPTPGTDQVANEGGTSPDNTVADAENTAEPSTEAIPDVATVAVPGQESSSIDTATAPPAPAASAPDASITTSEPPPASLAGIALPVPGAESSSPTVPPAPGGITVPTATTLPSVDVTAQAEAPPVRTWATSLAPAIVPPKTTFNYKRQIIPDAIYRTRYSHENQHLPKAITRDDYVRLLYDRVAANDVNATRALLNSGLQSYTADALAVARQSGARDTERLLLARGAS